MGGERYSASGNPDVERVPWANGRGFVSYGREPVECSYGSVVTVSESSSASGPHCWVRLLGWDAPMQGPVDAAERKRSPLSDPTEPYQAAAHLDRASVMELHARLGAWLADNPEPSDG